MAIEKTNAACFDDDTLRRFAADPIGGDDSGVAAHIFACPGCRRRFESVLYPEEGCSLTDAERGAISAFVRSRCKAQAPVLERLDAFLAARQTDFFPAGRTEWRMAAAAADGLEAAGERREDVRFVFVSDDGAPSESSWRAELSVPGEADGSAPLDLSVFGADGAPAGEGLFTLAGATLVVDGKGRATIPYDLFLAGIRNSNVAYQRGGGAAVPGSLVFF